MKISFLNASIIMFTFLFVELIASMNYEKAVVPVNRVGLFNMLLPKLRKPVFEQLYPADINALRRSCRLFSEVFSFCRPTIEFISYENKNIHPKDLKAILFAAIYDRKNEFVQKLWSSYRDYYKKDTRYEIKGTFLGLFLCIEKVENDELDLSVKTLEDQVSFRDCNRPDELLIACISRDTQRVLRVLESGKFDLKPEQGKIHPPALEMSPNDAVLRSLGLTIPKQEISYKHLQKPEAIYVVIDNDDVPTMRLMLKDKRFLEHIGRGGHCLLQRAIFKKRKKISELLIKSKYCEFSEKGPDYIHDWLTQKDNKKEGLYSLRAILNKHRCYIACWQYFDHIKNLLTRSSFCVID